MNEKEKASIRFTNQHEGFLEKITLNLYTPQKSLVITGIQHDDGEGNPDGDWLGDYFSGPVEIKKGQKAREFSFDYDLTYGGLIHRLTISHDYGKTWFAWNDADTIFKLTTAQ